MRHMQTAKKLIAGTPFEPVARKILRIFRVRSHQSEAIPRGRRDEADMIRLTEAVLKTNSNCVDIGAHKGAFLKKLVDLAPNGQHFAFEPIPALAKELSVKFPQVRVFDCALANETAEVTFHHVLNLPGWSGIKMQSYPIEGEMESIMVDLARLDDLLPPDVPIHLIKVDVEGAEYEVLCGAENIIRRDKPYIVFEHALIHSLAYGTTSEMMFDLLVRRYGLGIYCLNERGPLTKVEFTAICRSSHESDYDRWAQTNFVARVVRKPR
jgi:FkbM family methyltransferase